MKIELLETIGSTHEKDIVTHAVSLIPQVLGSKRFADLLMAAHLTEVGGRSNAQVLALLDSSDVKITVWLYNKWWSKVIGYTYFKTNTIYVNRKFFAGPLSVASNLIHEITHILGFTHNGVWATSLPYTINRIFEQVALEMQLPSGVS